VRKNVSRKVREGRTGSMEEYRESLALKRAREQKVAEYQRAKALRQALEAEQYQ